jgi:uroporphyrinogen decarboxylase
MTSKERVMKALDFESPNRMPRFDGFWGEFVENWRKEKEIGQEVDIRDYYGIDLSVPVADETFFPSTKGVVEKEGNYLISKDGWGRTVKTKKGSYFSETIDTVLRNRNDLDNLEFEPTNLDFRYKCFSEKVKEEKEKRAVFCKIGGPFIRSSFIRGEVEFLMDLLSDKSFAKALVEKVADHLVSIGLESLRRGNLYDTGVWIYDDMGSNDAPMFSPKTFEQIFLPVYKTMVNTLKEAGAKKVILHCDGNIVSFLDMVIEAGIDGINPVEPKAGMHILELKKKYGDKLSYIGGVDNAFVLPSGDKEKIKRHILPILETGKEGGIVIGTHSIGPDISVETYDFYHSLVRKYGDYSDNRE